MAVTEKNPGVSEDISAFVLPHGACSGCGSFYCSSAWDGTRFDVPTSDCSDGHSCVRRQCASSGCRIDHAGNRIGVYWCSQPRELRLSLVLTAFWKCDHGLNVTGDMAVVVAIAASEGQLAPDIPWSPVKRERTLKFPCFCRPRCLPQNVA